MNYRKLIEKALENGYAVRIYLREYSKYLNKENTQQTVDQLCSLIHDVAYDECEIMINEKYGADWTRNALVWIKLIQDRAYGTCRVEKLREFCDCELTTQMMPK